MPSNRSHHDRWPARLAAAGLALLLAGLTALPAARRATDARSPLQFVPPGGLFTSNVSVRLSAPSPNARIRFTLDGSEPTPASPLFTNAIVLTNSTLLRASAFEDPARPGEIVSQSYTLLDPSLVDFTSSLPLVIVQTFGRELPRDGRVAAAVRIIEPMGGRTALRAAPAFEGRTLASLRGRASLRYPKRSYNLRTVDESDNPVKVSLLDFPKDSDWILYAPYPDKTLMRDVLAYELSNKMGRYATRTKYVEVFVNETGGKLTGRDYLGVYVLEEKIKSGKQRVNIQKLGPGDVTEPAVTGGYIFKKDHSDRSDVGPPNLGGFPAWMPTSSPRPGFPTGPGGFPGDPAGFLPPYQGSGSTRESSSSSRTRTSSRPEVVTNRLGTIPKREHAMPARIVSDDDSELPSDLEGFRTARATNHLYFVEPEPDEMNAVQRAWLINYVNRFEAALYGPDFKDPLKGYAAYIDADSFIDHHLLVEATKNVDGFRFSAFLHKDRTGKINLGPIWDWNLSFGNANGKQGWLPAHWLWPQLDDREYSWFRRLFEDPDFGQKYVDRWAALRQSIFSTSNLLARIDELTGLLHEPQARNFQRWPILGRNVNPNWYIGNSYLEEVNWMKEWIEKRLDWIDHQFVAPPKASLSGAGAGATLNLTAPAGKIYFTLDGTDPRAGGGTVSPVAALYTAPIAVKPNARVVARVLLENRWSCPAP